MKWGHAQVAKAYGSDLKWLVARFMFWFTCLDLLSLLQVLLGLCPRPGTALGSIIRYHYYS